VLTVVAEMPLEVAVVVYTMPLLVPPATLQVMLDASAGNVMLADTAEIADTKASFFIFSSQVELQSVLLR
jgi:hypothetical protein